MVMTSPPQPEQERGKHAVYQDLGYGFTRRDWAEGRIIAFYSDGTSSHHAYDAWIAGRQAVLDTWDKSKPILFLHDFSKGSFTKYGLSKSQEFDKTIDSAFFGRVALVVPKTPVGHVIKMATTGAERLLKGRFNVRAFLDHDEALNWLKAGLDRTGPG